MLGAELVSFFKNALKINFSNVEFQKFPGVIPADPLCGKGRPPSRTHPNATDRPNFSPPWCKTKLRPWLSCDSLHTWVIAPTRPRCSNQLVTLSIAESVQPNSRKWAFLCPFFFNMYSTDLLHLIVCTQLIPRAKADEKHILGSCRPHKVGKLAENISVCVDEVMSMWTGPNRLLINQRIPRN